MPPPAGQQHALDEAAPVIDRVLVEPSIDRWFHSHLRRVPEPARRLSAERDTDPVLDRLPRAVQGPAPGTDSDLRGHLNRCAFPGLDPLSATRPHIELYVRWLQGMRRYRPSTVSRRMSVVAGFYRTCVIDAVLEHSPASTSVAPNVPAESPTLGGLPASSSRRC